MEKPHDHSDHISGYQTVTGPPDDGSNPVKGQETTVGGHTGTVIDDDPHDIKAFAREGMHKNPTGNPGRPRTPSRDDIVIRTGIPNKRPRDRR